MDFESGPYGGLHTVTADAWRFQATDVGFEHVQGHALGGPFAFGASLAVLSIANRRAQRNAECEAAAQWRPLGSVQISVDDERLLVLHDGEWASVWYDAITQVIPSEDHQQVEILFHDYPPYLLQGPHVPALVAQLLAALSSYGTTDSNDHKLASA